MVKISTLSTTFFFDNPRPSDNHMLIEFKCNELLESTPPPKTTVSFSKEINNRTNAPHIVASFVRELLTFSQWELDSLNRNQMYR